MYFTTFVLLCVSCASGWTLERNEDRQVEFRGSTLDDDVSTGARSRFIRSILLNQARVLSEWGEWSECNVTSCGIVGAQERSRTCSISGRIVANETICQHEIHQARPCEIPCLANLISRFSPWSEWSRCSVSCGTNGIQTRDRNCLQSSCTGPVLQQRTCYNQVTCPAWSQWEGWSECSQSCGTGGAHIRERRCQVTSTGTPAPSNGEVNDILKGMTLPDTEDLITVLNSSQCDGGDEASHDVIPCAPSSCRRHWSNWQTWSVCSVTCGTGFSSASRLCIGNTGPLCGGRSIRFRPCYSPPCWSSWSEYTPCSTSCGADGAFRTRRRVCRGTSSRVDQYMNCDGESVQRQLCNTETCPAWGSWSRFTRCSKSCNGGNKMRTRRCLSGLCRGRNIDVVSCNYQPCSYWSQWSSYTCCSVTCGGNGVKERRRSCRYGRYLGNRGCVGEYRQQTECSSHPCNTTFPSVFSTFECGMRNRRPVDKLSNTVLRIFGGQISEEHGWPWQASWQHKDCNLCSWGHLCGATLVAPRWVVTAAHCIEEAMYPINHNDPGDKWSVVVGMNRLNEDGDRYFIRKVFVHPNYLYRDVTEADIALVKLRVDVPLTAEVVPACLPQASMPVIGEECYVTGWGYTGPISAFTGLSVDLLEATVPVMNFSLCQNLDSLYQDNLNSLNHMCAGDPVTASRDTCLGDSGGPLSCRRHNDTWYIAGVTSFGLASCGSPGHVGIYAPFVSFEQWVRTTIENHTYTSC